MIWDKQWKSRGGSMEKMSLWSSWGHSPRELWMEIFSRLLWRLFHSLSDFVYVIGQSGTFKTLKQQGQTWHRPMAHPWVFRYISYSTTLAEHAIHCLRHVCSRLFIEIPTTLHSGWQHYHGPTNVGAMVKALSGLQTLTREQPGETVSLLWGSL